MVLKETSKRDLHGSKRRPLSMKESRHSLSSTPTVASLQKKSNGSSRHHQQKTRKKPAPISITVVKTEASNGNDPFESTLSSLSSLSTSETSSSLSLVKPPTSNNITWLTPSPHQIPSRLRPSKSSVTLTTVSSSSSSSSSKKTTSTKNKNRRSSIFRSTPQLKTSHPRPRTLSSSSTTTETSYSTSGSSLESNENDSDDVPSMLRGLTQEEGFLHSNCSGSQEARHLVDPYGEIAVLTRELGQANAKLDRFMLEWKHAEETKKLSERRMETIEMEMDVERKAFDEERQSLINSVSFQDQSMAEMSMRLISVEEEKESLVDELEQRKAAARSSAAEAEEVAAGAQMLRNERDELRNKFTQLQAKELELEQSMEKLNLRNGELEASLRDARLGYEEATERACRREEELKHSLQAMMMETKQLKGERIADNMDAEAKWFDMEASFAQSLRQRDDTIYELRQELKVARQIQDDVDAKNQMSPVATLFSRSQQGRELRDLKKELRRLEALANERQETIDALRRDQASKNAHIKSLETDLACCQANASLNRKSLNLALMERDQAQSTVQRHWDQYKTTKNLLQGQIADLNSVKMELDRAKRDRCADAKQIQNLSERVILTQEETKQAKKELAATKEVVVAKVEDLNRRGRIIQEHRNKIEKWNGAWLSLTQKLEIMDSAASQLDLELHYWISHQINTCLDSKENKDPQEGRNNGVDQCMKLLNQTRMGIRTAMGAKLPTTDDENDEGVIAYI